MAQVGGFNSARFKKEMANFARGNQFKLIIAAPLDLRGAFPDLPGVEERLSFKAKATTLPAFTIEPIQLSFRGRKCIVPGDRTLEPWTADIYLTEGFEERKFFERWSDMIVGISDASQAPDTDSDVTADGTLQQLDRNANVKTEYTFQNIWPSSVGEVSFDWDNGEPLTFSVTFEVNDIATEGVRDE